MAPHLAETFLYSSNGALEQAGTINRAEYVSTLVVKDASTNCALKPQDEPSNLRSSEKQLGNNSLPTKDIMWDDHPQMRV